VLVLFREQVAPEPEGALGDETARHDGVASGEDALPSHGDVVPRPLRERAPRIVVPSARQALRCVTCGQLVVERVTESSTSREPSDSKSAPLIEVFHS
jgi:hypothetical protein